MSLAYLTSRFDQLRRHPGYRRNPPLVLWRAVAWSLHCLLRIPARARFRRWDFRLYLPAKWHGGGSTSPYLFREDYEPELMLLERFLKPGTVFVDGGANTGVFTFTGARLVGAAGRVLAFEPGATCFDALQRSLALNRFEQVQLRRQALSDHVGSAQLFHHAGQENSFSLGGASDVACEEISTITLDQVVEEKRLPRVDFIKLDVEGAEQLVLQGARRVLRDWRPIVLFEINALAAKRLGLPVDGACRVLTEHDYQLFVVDERGDLLPADSLPQGVGNLLGCPGKRQFPSATID